MLAGFQGIRLGSVGASSVHTTMFATLWLGIQGVSCVGVEQGRAGVCKPEPACWAAVKGSMAAQPGLLHTLWHRAAA